MGRLGQGCNASSRVQKTGHLQGRVARGCKGTTAMATDKRTIEVVERAYGSCVLASPRGPGSLQRLFLLGKTFTIMEDASKDCLVLLYPGNTVEGSVAEVACGVVQDHMGT